MIRRLFWLAFLGAFVWFGLTVPLGKRTLFEHLRAIGSTPEAQDLKRGAEEEAGRVAERVRAGVRSDGAAAPAGTHESIDDKDRRGLQQLVDDKQAKAARAAPR